jgi:hypothetical protein
MDINTGLVLVVLAPAVLGEFFVWLKHRRDAADPPYWN